MNNRILDPDYTISFGRLYKFIAWSCNALIGQAVLFGSRPPPNDSIWGYAKKAGFEVILEDRKVKNKEERIDTGIVAAMSRDAYRLADQKKDTFALVGGDGDYVPAVRHLVEDGYTVAVVYWEHCSEKLREVASSSYASMTTLEFSSSAEHGTLNQALRQSTGYDCLWDLKLPGVSLLLSLFVRLPGVRPHERSTIRSPCNNPGCDGGSFSGRRAARSRPASL